MCAGAMLPLLPGSGGCTGRGGCSPGHTRRWPPGSIEDVIFERRFGCAAGFAALGGRVRVEGRTLYAEPGGTLQGTVLEAPDLRGGAALVIAALAAQGSSRITHTEFIDRGYADFAQKLTALGGQIARETPRGADCPKKRTSKT